VLIAGRHDFTSRALGPPRRARREAGEGHFGALFLPPLILQGTDGSCDSAGHRWLVAFGGPERGSKPRGGAVYVTAGLARSTGFGAFLETAEKQGQNDQYKH
jgi:hypothetical protein